ncbi:FAR1-related protein [Sesbania bispinosa]|nr:FAR1-related protein [Sesbania bispinosa]
MLSLTVMIRLHLQRGATLTNQMTDKNEMEFDVSNTFSHVPSQISSGRNIKKGKEKVDLVSTSKVKKVKKKKEKDSTQKKPNKVKIESMSYFSGGMPNFHQGGCSSGVMPNFPEGASMFPQMRFPSYGYGSMNHGVSMMPHYDGVHCYPQNGGVPLFPQHHQYFSQIPSVHNGSSWHDLLQHVSQNRGACSSNNLRPNPRGAWISFKGIFGVVAAIFGWMSH